MRKVIVVFLFVFATFFAETLESLAAGYDARPPSLSSAMGMNAHLGFDCSRKFIEELCLSMKEAGVQYVRLDVYWEEENWLKQKKVIDKSVYYADKYGLQILLNFPQILEKKDSAYLNGWLDMLKFYANRYDGKTPIGIEGEIDVRNVKVDFFEPMNEPDLNEKKMKLGIPVFFDVMAQAYKSIKSVRSDAFVVMPGMTNNNDITRRLLTYKSPDGLVMSDIVDVTNIHFYIDKQAKYMAFLDDWKSLMEKSGLQKKMHWVTECGASLWEFSQEEQAKLLPKQNIVALSKGFEKVFYYQYHAFGGNRGQGRHHQRQNYYGIIDPSVSNSYGSFYVNDGTYRTAITSGDASKRVYFRNSNRDYFALYSHTKTTLMRLKTSGLAIGGKGYTVKAVRLVHKDGTDKVLWNGSMRINENDRQVLSLPAIDFLYMSRSDAIRVDVVDVDDLNENWIGLQPWNAYIAYSVQTKFLTEKSTVPHSVDFGIKKLNVYTWVSPEKGRVWAVWANDGAKIDVKMFGDEGELYATDYMGKEVQLKNGTLRITDSMVYVSGVGQLKITRD